MAFGIAASSGLVSADPFQRAKDQYHIRNYEQFGSAYAPGQGKLGLSNQGFDMKSLMAQLVNQSNSANEANIARRDMINNMFNTRSANAENAFANLGASETRRINESAEQQKGESQQNLTSRGLAGTTLLSSNNNAIERNKNTALSDLNQNVALQKFGAGDSILSQQQQFNERINENGLNLGQLLPMLMALG
jgi:hypothetical protein